MNLRKFYDQPILVFSFLMAVFIAATEAPVWILIFSMFLFLWKWAIERYGFFKIPRRFTSVLSVGLLIQVYFQYRAVFAQEPSLTLLIGLSALKIMDYENDRDHQFLILLGFIMVAMKSIFSIDFYWFGPSLVAFFGLWYSMFNRQLLEKTKLLARMIVVSLPLILILFFAFPRVVVPWAMSRSTQGGKTGFSEQMAPGGVAELAQNNELAFRANLFDRIQTADNLYWRGNVLTRADGLHWFSPREQRAVKDFKFSDKGFSYEIIIEPGSKGFLFTLDRVVKIRSQSFPVIEYKNSVFKAVQYLDKAKSYQVHSDETLSDRSLPDEEHLKHIPLPPKTAEWVKKTKEVSTDPKERLMAVQNLFSDPEYVYTLNPGLYDSRDLDGFLFDRKKGFCEHFAGAYGTLVRALGIPSRIVVGYHGGSYNLFGNFWNITQRDAHAWAEVFVDGTWIRVDPTAWIAPLRLAMGGQSFFSLSEVDQVAFARKPTWKEPKISEVDYIEALTLWIDDLNYRWSYFLLDFDSDVQRSFWADLTQDIGLFLISGFLLIGLSLAFVRKILRVSHKKPPLELFIEQVIRWGEARGFSYRPHVPPLTHLEEMRRRFRAQSRALRDIARLYEDVSYRGASLPRHEFLALKTQWKDSIKEPR